MTENFYLSVNIFFRKQVRVVLNAFETVHFVTFLIQLFIKTIYVHVYMCKISNKFKW